MNLHIHIVPCIIMKLSTLVIIGSIALIGGAYGNYAQAGSYPLDVSKGENKPVEAWLKAGGTNPQVEKLGVNSLYWTRNGQPWTPVMGEFHFLRYPADLWETELFKMKAGGVSIVATYLF